MNIVCETCGARIAADDIVLSSQLAKCRSCDAVFNISSQLRQLSSADPWASQQAIVRPVVPQPAGITVVEDVPPPEGAADYRSAGGKGGRLVMKRSWYSHQLLFLALFCLVWDGFLVNWYNLVLGKASSPGLLFILFPMLHVAVGVSLTYRTLAGFLNTTWITVEGDTLTIRHTPLPWLGNRALPTSEIQQLYCDQSVVRNRGSATVTHNLSAVLRDGQKLVLLRSLPSDQALFLENRIEQQLQITPAPVAGEIGS